MKVYILPEVHAQIKYFVEKSHIEISGLGRIERDSQNNMVVSKIYLLKQENSAASTDICEAAAAQLMYESREDKGSLNFWWHSHVNMGTFWSSTDMATIRQFGKNGFLLSTVFNKKGEFRTSYFQGGNEFLPELFIDQIPTEFSYLATAEQTAAWEKEYEEKCRPKVYTHNLHNFSGRKWNNATGKWEFEDTTQNATGLGYQRTYGGWDGDDDYIPREYADYAKKNGAASDTTTTKSSESVWVSGRKIYSGMDCSGLTTRQLEVLKELEDKDTKECFEQLMLEDFKGEGYTTAPVGDYDEPFLGPLTKMTATAIIEALKKIFYMTPTPKWTDLTPLESSVVIDSYTMTLLDMNEQPTNKELTMYYDFIMKNYMNLSGVEYELLEAEAEHNNEIRVS